MSAEITIVSGFLGAGKTTLIQKLLVETFLKEKVVLIENDFGDISVDAVLLKSGGVEVRELNSGCICCSISGDFINALKDILDRFSPDRIIIEPSGVAKLSDIIKASSDPFIKPLAEIQGKITVVDTGRCSMYLDNFGEFFEDQIQNADILLLSRTAEFPEKVEETVNILRSLNKEAVILETPWEEIKGERLLHLHRKAEFDHLFGDHCHDHTHNHGAEDIFDTVTIRTDHIFSRKELEEKIAVMEDGSQGIVLRAKGILSGKGGYMNIQYLPGDLKIRSCTAGGDMLCIIGHDLNKQKLTELFSGKN